MSAPSKSKRVQAADPEAIGADGRVTAEEQEEPGSARDRILNAAEEVFAEKGIDGARVDEIARVAGVNKALIYYYFEGKANLIDALMERVIQENQQEKVAAIATSRTREEAIDNALAVAIRFIQKRRAIIGILLMELFKGGNDEPAMLKYLDRVLRSAPSFEDGHLKLVDASSLRIPALFFGVAPLAFFVLLEEKWIRHYGLNREKFEAEFFREFKELFAGLTGKLFGPETEPKQ